MSILDQLITGKVRKPFRGVLYGTTGIGKSTYGSKAPKPIFIQTEEGSDELDVTRLPVCESYSQMMGQLRALYSEKHDFQTLVLDTIDWAEQLAQGELCEQYGADSIMDHKVKAFGFGGGLELAAQKMRSLLSALDFLNRKGMNVLLLAHSKIEKYQDPCLETFDRYSLKLDKRVNALVQEWSQFVFFANSQVFVREGDDKRNRASTSGKRVIHTTDHPSYQAKNRFGLPETISLDDFNDFLSRWKSFYEETTDSKEDN